MSSRVEWVRHMAAMTKKREHCRRCRMTAPKPEHLYERWDGKWFCMPCLVLLMADAEIAQANQISDGMMEWHLGHAAIVSVPSCPICAIRA